jgi:hypothetical protein
MTMTDQSEDRRIVEAATPGEWELGKMANQIMAAPSTASDIPLAFVDYVANAAFIAHFDPPKITALLNNEKAQAEEIERLGEALGRIAGFVREKPGGDLGSYQRGYDIGFNNAGLVAAGIARAALTTNGTGE